MTLVVAGLLGVYSIAVGLIADRLLSSRPWALRYPRLILTTWHGAAVTCFGAICSATLLVSHDVLEHLLLLVVGVDKAALHQAYAGSSVVSPAWNLAMAIPAILVGLVAWQLLRQAAAAAKTRELLRDLLARTARPLGRRIYVLPQPTPMAFCLPGRDPYVVLSSGALTLLRQPLLDAVIEHEREHLRRRHDRDIAVAGAVGGVLRPCGLLRHYATEVHRLAELCADDAAVHKHGARTVARAILALSDLTSPTASATHAGTLSVTGSDAAERIRRLLAPHKPTPDRLRLIQLPLVAASGWPLLLPFVPAVRLLVG